MRTRTLLAAVAAAAVSAAGVQPAAAQATDTLYACYVPNTGNVYRIKTPDTQPNCLAPVHVQFSWKDIDLGIGGESLLRLRSGSPLTSRFYVDSAGGMVASGELGIGNIPASGPGYRTMWYPFKGAFRSGSANGTEWDDPNIGFFSWAGGNATTASGFASFAFGDRNVATAVGTVALGASNQVTGTVGFSAGASNRCSGFACTAVGFTNTASGQGSVALGYRVTADANFAVALGYRASVNGFQGSFVWGDASTTDSVEASANNQFSIRASGGVRLFTNTTLTTGVSLSAGGSSWNVVSDRNRKMDFLGVDGEDILARVRSVPVTTWRYRDEADRWTRHIGPMAQDWNRAFSFNRDPLTINMSDFDGVNFAAIQALEARTAELAEKTRQVEDLQARVARLEALVQQLASEKR